jgi:hypothetical protein
MGRRQRRHPVQVLGARNLLRGRDPGLRAGPGQAGRPAVVEPGGRHERAARAHDGDPAAQAELLRLVDSALHELAGRRQRQVTRMDVGHQAPTML